MKTQVLLAMVLLASDAYAGSDTLNTVEKDLETRITELDKQGWEAWKNNDPSWFIENTTENFQSISSDGISNKAEVVRSTPADCQVASYALADFNFTILSPEVVLLTYTATQDVVCGGEKQPSSLRVAVNYVKQEGRWLEVMYMQAP